MTSVPLNPTLATPGEGSGPRQSPPPLIGGVFTQQGLWIAVGMFVLVAGLFHHFLIQQHRFSYAAPADWSHAYMVPFIAGYLLWFKRDELAKAKCETFWPGMLIVLLSIACYVFFLVGVPNHMGQGWSMVLCIFGLTLFLAGPAVASVAALPIAYLALGVTISSRVMDQFTFPLQMIGAQGADVVLNCVGLDCTRSGNQLLIVDGDNKIPLNVAQACSGMRMVIAFIALGAAVALVAVKPWWQRVLLMMMGVPVAVAMNILRVAVLGIASTYKKELSEGDFHMFIGTLMLVPGFLLYLGIAWALKKAVVDESETKDAKKAPEPAPVASTVPEIDVNPRPYVSPAMWRAVITACVVMIVSAAGLSAAVSKLGLYLSKLGIHAPDDRKVSAIPTELPSWVRIGQDEQMSAEIVDELGTDNYLTRNYVQRGDKVAPGAKPKRIAVHMAYYTGIIDTVPHVPERCVVGAGWLMTGSSTDVDVPLDLSRFRKMDNLPAIEVKRGSTILKTDSEIALPRDLDRLQIRITEFAGPNNGRLYAGYFFIANGGHVSNPEGVRTLAFNLEDKYAYYLKIQFSTNDVKDREELAALAGSWMSEALPEIARCVPDWIEVEHGRYPANAGGNTPEVGGADGGGVKR